MATTPRSRSSQEPEAKAGAGSEGVPAGDDDSQQVHTARSSASSWSRGPTPRESPDAGPRQARRSSGEASLSRGGSSRVLPPGVRRPSIGPKVSIRLKKVPSAFVIKDAPPETEPDEAATMLQALYRGNRDRARVDALKAGPSQAEIDAATRIQAVSRGNAARKRLPPPRPSTADLEANAIRIQALARGRAARRKPLPTKPLPPPPNLDANATRIQAIFRGRQARKAKPPSPKRKPAPPSPVAAAAPAPAKAAPVIPMGAGRMRADNAKLTAEVGRLKARIQSLERDNKQLAVQVDSTTDELHMQRGQTKAAEEMVEEAQEEIRLLEEQIQKEVDDFESLREVLQDKDDALAQKVAQLHDADLSLKAARMEQDRLREMIKQRDARIDELTPDMVDVALSPRPLDDSRAIKLRDEALLIKDRQIADMTAKTQEYMLSLEAVEQEVKNMQEDTVVRDAEFQKNKAQLREFKKEVIRLQNIIKSSKGQKYAMDVAAKQNTQLLQLLEAAEKDQTQSEVDRDQAFETVEDMRAKMMDAIRDAAIHEAEALTQGRDARVYARKVAILQTKLDTTTFNLQQELRAVKVEARTQVDAVQGELQMRRQKQYELLDKLSRTEERLRAEADRGQDAIDKARLLQQRTLDLEAELLQAKERRQQEFLEAQAVTEKQKASIAQLREQLQLAVRDKNDTNKQMMDMGQTVVQLAERQRVSEDAMLLSKEGVNAKEGEIMYLKERLAQLMDKELRGDKLRMELEMERNMLREKLEAIETEYAELLHKTRGAVGPPNMAHPIQPKSTTDFTHTASIQELGSGWKGSAAAATHDTTGNLRELELQNRMRRLQSKAMDAKNTRRKIIERAVYLHCHGLAAMEDRKLPEGAPAAPPHASAAAKTLGLANLGLDDEDVAVLVETLCRPPPRNPFELPSTGPEGTRLAPLTSLDLRHNNITDTGAMLLATVIANKSVRIPGRPRNQPAYPLSRLAFLDLRGNSVSNAGVRALGDATRSSSHLSVAHVYVGRTGLVQALGPRAPEPQEDGVVAQPAIDVKVVAVVDVTDNNGDVDGNATRAANELRGKVRAGRLADSAGTAGTGTGTGTGSGAGGAGAANTSLHMKNTAASMRFEDMQARVAAAGYDRRQLAAGRDEAMRKEEAEQQGWTDSQMLQSSQAASVRVLGASASASDSRVSFKPQEGDMAEDRVSRLLEAASQHSSVAGLGSSQRPVSRSKKSRKKTGKSSKASKGGGSSTSKAQTGGALAGSERKTKSSHGRSNQGSSISSSASAAGKRSSGSRARKAGRNARRNLQSAPTLELSSSSRNDSLPAIPMSHTP